MQHQSKQAIAHLSTRSGKPATIVTMNLAILTDIHANREALEACLEHAASRGAEQYAFLGDLVGYGCDPDWVMQTIMAYCAKGGYAVLGNHDQAVLRGASQNMRSEAKFVIEWTRAKLSDAQLGFLDQLPFTVTLPSAQGLKAGDTLLVHANAAAPSQWGYIHSTQDAQASFAASPAARIFCGHMHNPMLYHDTPTGKASHYVPTSGNAIHLAPHRRWLAIPGSVGQPRDGTPDACYALFNTDTLVLTYWRVAYDFDTTAAKIRAAGMPQNLAHRLTLGK